MSQFTIVIGNKNYSSWSLRGWLALRVTGVEFDEVHVLLRRPTTRAAILAHSPGAKVPVLHHGDTTVWESMAICEYLAEQFPEAKLWPDDAAARTHARIVSAEMHGGFGDMRGDMPMNCRAHYPGRGLTQAAMTDIARIDALWCDCRMRFGAGGDFLFGGFTIADVMFAPVASRFVTYEPALSPTAKAYVDAMNAHPAMVEWVAASRDEPDTIYEMEI